MSPTPPRLRPSRLRFPAGAILVAAVASVGCGPAEPPADLLLVAGGGPLQAADGSGSLVAFDGPTEPVVAVAASGGRVVAATAAGSLLASSESGTPRTWRAIRTPTAAGSGIPLMAVSPLGNVLALLTGEPQGERFDVILVDLGGGPSRTIPVARGLNGPPAWIGSATLAVDVIGPDGGSEIALIDLDRGDVTDLAVSAHVVSATLDGRRVAVDEPGGDVLVGDIAAWRSGTAPAMTRLDGPPGVGVESLAISPDGTRLAIVRRRDSGIASIELLRSTGQGWAGGRSPVSPGDGTVSIAWLQ